MAGAASVGAVFDGGGFAGGGAEDELATGDAAGGIGAAFDDELAGVGAEGALGAGGGRAAGTAGAPCVGGDP